MTKQNDFLMKNPNSHFILYSHDHLFNYNHILNIIKKLSPSELKYNRKTILNFNSNELSFQTSDIHIEIDFELLGVNEY